MSRERHCCRRKIWLEEEASFSFISSSNHLFSTSYGYVRTYLRAQWYTPTVSSPKHVAFSAGKLPFHPEKPVSVFHSISHSYHTYRLTAPLPSVATSAESTCTSPWTSSMHAALSVQFGRQNIEALVTGQSEV
jgi:hypothetical protein